MSQVQVGLDARGDATAVWVAWDVFSRSPTFFVQTASKPRHGAWHRPFTLSRYKRGVFYASVAVEANGSATAVWHHTNPPVVQASSTAPHRPWGSPVTIFSPAAAYTPPIYDLGVALDRWGDALALYSLSGDVQAIMRSPTGAWHRPISIGHGYSPRAAFDAQGNAVAAWIDSPSVNHASVQSSTFTRGR